MDVDRLRAENPVSDGRPNPSNASADACVHCGHCLAVDYTNDLRICQNCCIVDAVPLFCQWSYITQGHVAHTDITHLRQYTSAAYNHEFYSNEKLDQANGTDPQRPEVVVQAIRQIGGYLTGGDTRLLTETRIRRILKFLGKSKYGENWWQLYKRVNFMPENEDCIPEDVIAYLKRGFRSYLTACLYLMKHNFLNRTRVLCYNFVYRKLFELHDEENGTSWWEQYGGWFKQLRSQRRVKQYETDWAKVLHFIKNDMRKTREHTQHISRGPC